MQLVEKVPHRAELPHTEHNHACLAFDYLAAAQHDGTGELGLVVGQAVVGYLEVLGLMRPSLDALPSRGFSNSQLFLTDALVNR